MKVETNDLMTVRNYSLKVGCTPAWVYRLGEAGDITIIKIDGVQFVKIR